MTKALNAAFARSVREPGKYSDGLFLLVKPNGTRFWVQRITTRGKRRETGLESPDFISLADARDKAL